MVLRTYEIDSPYVRYSGVNVGPESGIFRRIEPCWSRNPGEVVDHQHALAESGFRDPYAESLGRKTLSAFVEGYDPVAVDVTGSYGDFG